VQKRENENKSKSIFYGPQRKYLNSVFLSFFVFISQVGRRWVQF